MRERRILTYANVCSTLALVLALGGVSWAATVLPRNSVGTTQLKRNAVDTTRVRDGSLANADLRPGARFLDHVAAGGLAGTYPNPTIATDSVGGENIRDGSLSLVDMAKTTTGSGFPSQVIDAGKCASEALGPFATSFLVFGNLVLRPGFRAFFDWRAQSDGHIEPYVNVCNDTATSQPSGDVPVRVYGLRERP